MPRPSPQTERVVAVIEYLSDRPDGASSTQIAHDTGINASTCVHVLADPDLRRVPVPRAE